jgi:NAD(P)-dependent dehydrogenase (short-subunit alcohol dehydrogenase family)
VVVVTGAGGGIGSRIVDRFLANGDRVIGLDRAEPSLKELAATRKAGEQLSTSYVDVTDAAAVAAFAKQVQQTYGPGFCSQARG